MKKDSSQKFNVEDELLSLMKLKYKESELPIVIPLTHNTDRIDIELPQNNETCVSDESICYDSSLKIS